jgi:hypothetical protein
MYSTIMLSGKGKVLNMPTKAHGKEYKKIYIYVSANVSGDSQFPFKPQQEVEVVINADRTLTIKSPTKQ